MRTTPELRCGRSQHTHISSNGQLTIVAQASATYAGTTVSRVARVYLGETQRPSGRLAASTLRDVLEFVEVLLLRRRQRGESSVVPIGFGERIEAKEQKQQGKRKSKR